MAFRIVVIGKLAPCQGLGFHLQIDFDVNVGRIERDMPEPGANGIDVDAGAEQVRGCGMPHVMGADAFCRQ